MLDEVGMEYNLELIKKLSQILGKEDLSTKALLNKIEQITDRKLIIEHQQKLSSILHREIPLQTAFLDYLLSGEIDREKEGKKELGATKDKLYSSIIDSVTGLFNQRHFHTILDVELRKAKELGVSLSLLLFNVDNFDVYLNLYWKDSADILLNEIAIILRKNCRKSDMLFRIHEERFAIILLNMGREDAHRLAKRLSYNVLKARFKGEDKLPGGKITLSGGIAVFPEDGKNAHTLLLSAEEALITAIKSGRGRVLEHSTKRRRYPRVEANIKAKYYVEGRKDIKVQKVTIKNISEVGALVEAETDVPLGNNITLLFTLPNREEIKVKGEAIRLKKEEQKKEVSVAIKFTSVDQNSFSRLKQFIQEKLSERKGS